MLLVVDDRQQVIAEFSAQVGSLFSKRVITSGDFSRVMMVMRCIPRDVLQINVKYPLVSDQSFPFTIHGANMNLEMYAPKTIEVPDQTDTPQNDVYYFVPRPIETPDDGFLNYATIESIKDLFGLPTRTVVMLRADQENILRAVSDYAALFHIDPKVITGLPGSTYSATFDEATWSFDKVAYVPFINELSTVSELNKQLADENKTPYALERDQYTRADGSVKKHAAFIAPDEDGTDDDEQAEFQL